MPVKEFFSNDNMIVWLAYHEKKDMYELIEGPNIPSVISMLQKKLLEEGYKQVTTFSVPGNKLMTKVEVLKHRKENFEKAIQSKDVSLEGKQRYKAKILKIEAELMLLGE